MDILLTVHNWFWHYGYVFGSMTEHDAIYVPALVILGCLSLIVTGCLIDEWRKRIHASGYGDPLTRDNANSVVISLFVTLFAIPLNYIFLPLAVIGMFLYYVIYKVLLWIPKELYKTYTALPYKKEN